MNNYLMLNGRQIDFTEEQVAEIKQSFGIGNICLSEIGEGETFKISKYEFILLELSGDTAAVILKEPLYERKQFGENNNYDGQFCLHMVGSKTHGSDSVNSEHQSAIRKAYNWAH